MTAASVASRASTSAWWSLLLNVVVFPGVGTLLLGRGMLGTAQLACGTLGFGLLLSGAATSVALILLLGALAWSAATALDAVFAARG